MVGPLLLFFVIVSGEPSPPVVLALIVKNNDILGVFSSSNLATCKL